MSYPPPDALLMDLRERMVRIETKLDTHADTHTGLRTDVDAHDERLAKLESGYKLLVTIGGAVLFFATFFQSAITSALGL